MALMRARIGARTGERGRARAKLANNSRRALSSSVAVSAVTSWSRTGQSLTVVLLGDHVIKRDLEAVPVRGYEGLPVEERDGYFQVATVVPQLIGSHGGQGGSLPVS